MVAIDRQEMICGEVPDIPQAIMRYMYVAKLGLEKKTLKDLKG